MTSSMSSVVNAASSVFNHLLLKGLPLSATSGDLRRAVMLAGLQGVTDVSLDYQRFQPSKQGYLTFSGPEYMRNAFPAAKEITFTGSEKITAVITSDPAIRTRQRLRGIKGRADALNRGLLGFGPSAGGFPAGKTVTVVGFPGKSPIEKVLHYVRGFRLAGDEQNSVIQVPLPTESFSLFSRHIVMLESESEAQRLVRKLHLTPYIFRSGTRYITAEVLY